jgi:preprotein translocase subunit SecY
MLKTFLNVFRVPELRNKVLFTLFMLMIYRIGFSVPLPGVDQTAFQEAAANQSTDSAAGRLATYVSIFSGGNINQSTIFGLGLMPYISASIIFQLLATVVPTLEKMQKEGESGRRKIQEWSRYATVLIAIVQGAFWLRYMESQGLVLGYFTPQPGTDMHLAFWAMGLTILVSGTLFLMWLGEQIDEYGLGNGVSMLIMAGILAQMPGAIATVIRMFNSDANADASAMGTGDVVFLLCSFLFVTAFAILITQAQRRIPIQQAKYTRGRSVYGGQKQFLPLRLNHGGVMPVIFAQSLMLFPGVLLGLIVSWTQPVGNNTATGLHSFAGWLSDQFKMGAALYVVTEIALIYFFAYFWTTIQFQPKEMAKQLQDYGSFVPGIRPGKRTADYLQSVMYRITFVGAGFLCIIAVIPTIFANELKIPYLVASFLGGTGLLIVISVALDIVQRIEANLMMRNYGGFLGGEGNKSKRIRGRNY